MRLSLFLFIALLVCGCKPTAQQTTATDTDQSQAASTTSTSTTASSSAAEPSSAPSSATLDASRGNEIGFTFEAFLSPHQESNEETNTPSSVPQQFRSTTASMTRDQREAAGHRGHGQVRFSKDFSRAWVDVRVEGVDLATVNMFHIHCGQPGILGPILVDFSLATDVRNNLADGLFSVELKNEHIAKTAEGGHSMIDAFTRGCIIGSPTLDGLKPAKVMTIGGMAQLAMDGQLYFNLHTTGQTYYGDLRGQLYPADAR